MATQKNGLTELNGVVVDINSPEFQSAFAACKSLLASTAANSGADEREQALLNFAACMRANGVPEFADPNTQGGFVTMGNGGLDPDSLEFQDAMQLCRAELAGLMGP